MTNLIFDECISIFLIIGKIIGVDRQSSLKREQSRAFPEYYVVTELADVQ